MNVGEYIKEHFSGYLKLSISLIVFLFGLVFIVWGYNLSHPSELKIVKDGEGNEKIINESDTKEFQGELLTKAGEFLLLILALHFLYDTFVKATEKKEFLADLHKELSPQQEDIKFIKSNLTALYEQARLVLDLVSYTDSNSFEMQFNNMIENYEKFWLIGDIPPKYLEKFRPKNESSDKEKQVLLYTTVDDKTRDLIKENMKSFDPVKNVKFRAFHINRFDWGFTIIAGNRQENKIEVLLNYNTSSYEQPSGYFMFGDTAIALHKSVGKRLANLSASPSSNNEESAIPVNNEYMVEYLSAINFDYKNLLDGAREGVNLKGDREICERMSDLLRNCEKYLDVSHIAEDRKSIDVLASPEFKRWLDVNYEVIHRETNKVHIRRVFLIGKNELENEILRECIREQKSKGVHVRYCFLEDISHALREDFSVYDGKDLVYISQEAGGSWRKEPGEDKNQAKHSSNQAKISHFKEIFNQLWNRAKEYE